MASETLPLEFTRRVRELSFKVTGQKTLVPSRIPIQSFEIVCRMPEESGTFTASEYPFACLYLSSVLEYGTESLEITHNLVIGIADFFPDEEWRDALTGPPRFRFLRLIHFGSRIERIVWRSPT